MRRRDPDLGLYSQGIFRLIQSIPKAGGAVAGLTRKDIETQSGMPVISSNNFKQLAVKKSKKVKGSES